MPSGIPLFERVSMNYLSLTMAARKKLTIRLNRTKHGLEAVLKTLYTPFPQHLERSREHLFTLADHHHTCPESSTTWVDLCRLPAFRHSTKSYEPNLHRLSFQESFSSPAAAVGKLINLQIRKSYSQSL